MTSAGWPCGVSVARTTPPWTTATWSGWARARPATASVAKSAGSLKRYVIVDFLHGQPGGGPTAGSRRRAEQDPPRHVLRSYRKGAEVNSVVPPAPGSA